MYYRTNLRLLQQDVRAKSEVYMFAGRGPGQTVWAGSPPGTTQLAALQAQQGWQPARHNKADFKQLMAADACEQTVFI